MTCSMLSANIAVAVPKKYIRKPGCRKAANEVGATGEGLDILYESPARRAATRASAAQSLSAPPVAINSISPSRNTLANGIGTL